MTTTAPAAGSSVAATSADQIYVDERIVGYARSPSDALRVVVFGTVAVVVVAATQWAHDGILGFEEDLLQVFTFLSPSVERLLAGATQLFVGLVLLVIWVTPIVTRRYRVLGYVAVASLVSAALVELVEWWFGREEPATIANELALRAGIPTHDFPTTSTLAAIAAAFVILGPFVTVRWRRAGWVVLGILVLLRLLLSAHLPSEMFVALTIGATVGAAVLFVFGRPDQHPTTAAVARALESTGLSVASIEPAQVDARGSTPYFVELDDGGRVFTKVMGADERAADLLFRIYRFVRFKNIGDERPFSSLRRTVEHEALVALQARDVGARTPRMRAVAEVGNDSLLLTYDLIDGRSLDRVDPAGLDDVLLRAMWEQVAVLRRHRIAHRDLRRANLFVDDAGQPWIIDFGFSEVAARDDMLAADVAQLLASVAVAVGAERAVSSAVEVLGPEAVAASLPRLQVGTMSGATRAALNEHPGLLKELQQTVEDRCGIVHPEFAQLHRVTGKAVFAVVMLVAVTYFLVPQLADIPGIVDQVEDARWEWLPLILIASAVSYVGAMLSISGSVPDRLRSLRTLATEVASSFAGKLAPAAVGGMALNVRYLQKAGVDPAVAVSGVGMNSVGGFVLHLLLLVLFVVWVGEDAFGSLSLPDWHIFGYGVAVVVLITAVALAIPAVRRILAASLVPVLRRSVGGIGVILRRPSKLALLLGGSAIVTMSYVTAMYFSTLAFGGDLAFARVGAVYLAGAAVASAAPTPGGLGALEAALVAGLVAAGMESTAAVPSVFLYRLATFWLPVLPGWIAFSWLRREDYV